MDEASGRAHRVKGTAFIERLERALARARMYKQPG
jgi:hypothetical protein